MMSMESEAPQIQDAIVEDMPQPKDTTMPKNIWMHGLTAVILLILSHLAMTLTAASGVVQFFWMLIAKERNVQIQRFGDGLAHWLGKAVGFITGKSEGKPFPWSDWKA